MKNALRVVLVVLTFSLIFSSLSFAQGGADLFKAKCAMCHGPDGKGQTTIGKNLNLRDLGSADVQGQSDADLTKIIADGKGKMKGFADRLSKDQIGDVVKYIRTLKH